MKLIITRHGETEDNLKDICTSHMPGKLTKEGIEQAKKLALRLKEEKIDAIYSSDLKRARDTAKEIVKFHPSIKVKFTKELRETDFGSITGIKGRDVNWKNLPKDFETADKLWIRAKRFLDRVYLKHKNDTVLFVCHAEIMCALVGNVTNKGPESIREVLNIKNTAISIFELKENKNHVIHLLNDTAHL